MRPAPSSQPSDVARAARSNASTLAGSLSSMKLSSTLTKRSGSSSNGKWPASSKISSRLCGISSCAALRVGDGDQRVAPAPEDQHRHAGREVQLVARVDALAAEVEDRARRVQEGAAGVLVAERREAVGDPWRSGLGCSPTRASQRAGRGARAEHAGPRERRQHEVGAREGRGAQHHVDLASEAAAGDEREALDALGELVGELHRDAAAERVADDRRALVAEREQQVADEARERAERVVAASASPSAPWPIRSGAITVWRAASAGMTGAQQSELDVMPWIRTSGGPSPSVRKQTGWPWRSIVWTSPAGVVRAMILCYTVRCHM